jgi:DNA-binding NtrC family response regulator
LFLDEVTEIPLKSQVDLLRVLETGQFTRVGGEEVVSSDARIVSASNKEITSLIEDGSFREDLYYRLNVIPIHVPPLRQRRDDIPLLVEHFLEHFCERHKRAPKNLTADAMQMMAAAHWPGNVRQLRNVVERLVVTVRADEVGVEDLPIELKNAPRPGDGPILSLAAVTEDAEKRAIHGALASCGFHREQTAKALDISVRSLHYKMSRYGLH